MIHVITPSGYACGILPRSSETLDSTTNVMAATCPMCVEAVLSKGLPILGVNHATPSKSIEDLAAHLLGLPPAERTDALVKLLRLCKAEVPDAMSKANITDPWIEWRNGEGGELWPVVGGCSDSIAAFETFPAAGTEPAHVEWVVRDIDGDDLADGEASTTDAAKAAIAAALEEVGWVIGGPTAAATTFVVLSTCAWTFGPEFAWHTSCGRAFVFTDDTGPNAHGFRFCPYCGKGLAEKLPGAS